MEPALEQLVREKVKRGTVQLSVKIERPRRPEDFRLNLVALASYRDQLKGFQGSDQRTIDVSQLLLLPGVVEQISSREPSSPTKTGPRSPRWSSGRSRIWSRRVIARVGRWPPS